MADARFCVGFSSACKQAREGGGLPATAETRLLTSEGLYTCHPRRRWLPPDIVRLIDSMVRRLEHEDTLLSMNGGDLGTTLCQAATAGGILDVRFLLKRGADVEARTVFVNEIGEELTRTPLLWAASTGKVEVARALLDAGAGELEMALYTAAFNGRTPVVALLLDRGADIHDNEDDCVMVAAQGGYSATVTLLLDRGSDVHARDDMSLVYAAQNGHLETIRLLLDRGSLVHAQDNSSLRMAAQRGHLEIVRLLLDRGADIEAQNGQPFLEAVYAGHLEVVRLVLDRGADVHARNECALRLAREKGHAAVVALLL